MWSDKKKPWRPRAACSLKALQHWTCADKGFIKCVCALWTVYRKRRRFAKRRQRGKEAVISLYSIYWTEYALVFVLVMSFWLFMSLLSRWNVPLFLSKSRHPLFIIDDGHNLPHRWSHMISPAYHIPASWCMYIQDTCHSYLGVWCGAFFGCCVVAYYVRQAAASSQAVQRFIIPTPFHLLSRGSGLLTKHVQPQWVTKGATLTPFCIWHVKEALWEVFIGWLWRLKH